MNFRLGFKEYFDSKQVLREMAEVSFNCTTRHEIIRYCKVPFILTESLTKTYVSIKPRDIISVNWSTDQSGNRLIESVKLSNKDGQVELTPSWDAKKIKSWIEHNSIQLV